MSDKSELKRPRATGTKTPADDIAGWPIEKCFEELERIVAALESQATTLEESLKLFERGILLSRRCSQELTTIEKRIQVIMESAKGDVQLKDFQPADEDA
jgi:exodeoxyribonuclease VII small subunit